MFLGHFGVGFAAKKIAPQVSLGTLFLSAQFVDLLWPTLLLFGVEHVKIEPGITKITPLNFIDYPISHSLLMVCLWGGLFSAVYWITRKNQRSALVVGALVVSHWALDLIVHRPDLPLFPGDSPLLGLGLWNSIPATLIAEGTLFFGGALLYLRSTKAINRSGAIGLWCLVGFLVLVYIGNLTGPLPPDTTAIAWVGQLQWILIPWAYWIDKNRIAVKA